MPKQKDSTKHSKRHGGTPPVDAKHASPLANQAQTIMSSNAASYAQPR